VNGRPGLAQICALLGLDPAAGEPVQRLVNHTYRFPRAGLLVRLSPDSSQVDRLVRVAAELERLDVPTIRLASAAVQPVRAGGWAATVWRLLPSPPAERYPAADLAIPLRRLHSSRFAMELPRWNLLGATRDFLEAAAAADDFDAWTSAHVGWRGAELLAELRRRCDALAEDLAGAAWSLPPGTVHGDAHTGNLLRLPTGEPVLCDLDSVGWGPVEADLAPAAHGVTRFRRDVADYERLVRRYGFDVRESPAWLALRRLRDLQLAVYMLRALPGGAVATELARRLETVLTDDEWAVWRRYPGAA
jgi:aminoglycoside phosphotransferase (APT) family kinase protein